eukprot:184360-Alexandrium_andersonii.AAC.1
MPLLCRGGSSTVTSNCDLRSLWTARFRDPKCALPALSILMSEPMGPCPGYGARSQIACAPCANRKNGHSSAWFLLPCLVLLWCHPHVAYGDHRS